MKTLNPTQQKIVEQLRAEAEALSKQYAAAVAKTQPLAAKAEKAWKDLEKIEAEYDALREQVVAIEVAEGLAEIQRERARVARAINAITGGPGASLEGGSHGVAP